MLKRSINFICTLNNPNVTVTELADVCKRNGTKTLAAQLEKGESGTPHIQFFLGFDN